MRGLTVLFPAVIMVISQSVFSQSNIAILDEDLISGNRISGITEWNHTFRGAEPSETGTVSLRARYNNNGYQVEEVTFNPRGEESRRITSRFDNSGNRTEHRITDLRNNRLTFSQMASFDNHGNKTAEWGFDGLGNYRNIFHLKPDGRIDYIEYTTQGTLNEKREFTYSGNETQVKVFLPDGTVTEIIRLVSNSRGDLITESYYDGKGLPLRKVEYSYDSRGIKTGERRYTGDTMQFSNRFIYEGDLLMKVVRSDREGRQNTVNRYFYNEKNQLIREEWFNENSGNYSSRDYSWDNYGNMVSVECYYATYEFRVLYRYDYSFF